MGRESSTGEASGSGQHEINEQAKALRLWVRRKSSNWMLVELLLRADSRGVDETFKEL